MLDDSTKISLAQTISDSNKKLFGVGLHAINELHVRFPDLTQKDMGVAWFGGGLQGQLPLLLNMFPEVLFEMHTQRPCPVGVGLWETVDVAYHNTSLEEFLQHVEYYKGNRKFAVLVDLDYHLKPEKLTKMNHARIVPTVESESVHYDRYTAVYDATCARLARCGHVMLVSTPFRMPWITRDYSDNAHKASWRDASLGEHEVRCTNMRLFPQFASRVKSTEMRGLLMTGGAGRGELQTVVDWQALDKRLNDEDTASRELARATFMLEQLETYQKIAVSVGMSCSKETACMRAWSAVFVENSIDEMRALLIDHEIANSDTGIYKAQAPPTWSKAA